MGVVLDLGQRDQIRTRGLGFETNLALSLKGYGIVEGVASGCGAHVEAGGGGQHARVQRGEGRARLAGVAPAAAPHGAVRALVPQVLGKLLVEPVVHEPLAVRVEPVGVALVEAGVHLGPEVLAHAGARDDGRPLVRAVRVLLHVLGQVGLLGVALSTIGTNVCLYVLGLLVLGDVVEEGLLVSETLVAGVTFVWLVRLVTPGVGLQVGQLGEGLRATWNSALVWFVPGVSPDVLLQVG